ncbi:GFA family protein [Aureimonas flava]|uniref:GFA family protein n=1 Tax=Aureimonas flava TaxID=2320271 RepID=A0A3A1WR79_9HYPH|nr:GFA family protein [Aureimonas flava]RIY03554.1 GFA family protein [Aureimonas flava]
MDDATKGECRCGQLKISVRGRPMVTMACHCTGCRKLTASAFSLSALYRVDAFAIDAGETVIGGLHGRHRHFFCSRCLSWVFTRPEGMDELVDVRSTMLDGVSTAPPFIETETAEKLPWIDLPVAHSFERFPERTDFPGLLAEFAAQNA